MEVYVVLGGYWCSVERGGLVMPAAKRGLDLFVDAVANRLYDFRLNYIALGVDRHFDNDISHQVARQFGAVDGRVRIHHGIGNMDLVTGNRSINHSAERRSCMRIVVASLSIGQFWLWLRRRLLRLRSRKWSRLAMPWKQQLRSVWGRVSISARRKVDQFVGMSAVSEGKRCGAQIEHFGIVEDDQRQKGQMRGHRHCYRAIAPQCRGWLKTRGLKTVKHSTY